MVIGSVGSGKSTVAMSVLGEVDQIKGKRSLIGSVAYVPQEVQVHMNLIEISGLDYECNSQGKYSLWRTF